MNECFRSTAVWIYRIKWWSGPNLLLSKVNVGNVYCKELRWNKTKANESCFSHDLSVAHLWTENKFWYLLELSTACEVTRVIDQINLCTTVDPFISNWGTEKNCKWRLFSHWLAGDPAETKDKSHTCRKVAAATATSLRGLFGLHPPYLLLLVI